MEYVVVEPPETASKWFSSQEKLVRLNPKFVTLAFDAYGGILREFAKPRNWTDILPGERLRIS